MSGSTTTVLMLLLGARIAVGQVGGAVDVKWKTREDVYAGYSDGAARIAVASSGDCYVAGLVRTVDGLGGSYRIAKYDNTGGSLIWDDEFDPTPPSPSPSPRNALYLPIGLTLDETRGAVYLVGTAEESNGTPWRMLVVRYSTGTGERDWVTYYSLGPLKEGSAVDAAVDSSGDVYVAGSLELPDSGLLRIAAAKFSGNSGTIQWSATHMSGDEAVSILVGSDFAVIAGTARNASNDYAVVKYRSSDGVELWHREYNRSYGGQDMNDDLADLALDGAGNVFVTGASGRQGISTYDWLTMKYSSNGDLLWSNSQIGGNDGQWGARAIALDGNGAPIVTGSAAQDPVTQLGSRIGTVKYNASTGAIAAGWPEFFDGETNGPDIAHEIAVGGNNAVYVTGASRDNLGISDTVTIKYSSAGVQKWVHRYNPPDIGTEADFGAAVAVGPDSTLYVTGGRVYYSYGFPDFELPMVTSTVWSTIKFAQ